ncbi:hypothetical protein IE53DRAFT_387075 [Violaceomyces palustris]|uniref:Uncharacterized protein n=1 Tax=Violaceomyces palustris TaxID=1673888 RepID=A0ACD0NXQ2_9BASI|nr:hypothetical protein IE53DRAFT_387075 [Violaceomyces palustris]
MSATKDSGDPGNDSNAGSSNSSVTNDNTHLSPSIRPAQSRRPSDRSHPDFSPGAAPPSIPNIPPRIGSPSPDPISISTSPGDRNSAYANQPSFASSFQQRRLIAFSDPPSRDSNSAIANDSEVSTPLSLGELESLPISDEQKARIIDRHLARPDSMHKDGGASASSITIEAHGRREEETASENAGPSRPLSYATSRSADGEIAEESTFTIDTRAPPEEYFGPHSMQGGAITDDVYRWAHKNRRTSNRRTRSESLHLPRTATIDPELDVQGIKEPGGFRRFFVVNQATAEGRPPPRALRSFIDFLSLYGHFAGEYLEELEEDEDEEEEEVDEEEYIGHGTVPGSSREPGTGSTEASTLLQRPRGRRDNTASRIRKASQDKRRGEASMTDAVMMLLKSFVGTGILFLGKAFFNGGLLFSIVTLCAIAVISLVSFLLLVKTNLNCPGSFGDMGGILYGPRFRLAILASIVLSQLGFVAAYTVFVAQNLQAFILAVTHCKKLIPIPYLILAQCAVFLPLSLVRKIAKLSSTALIADAFILFGVGYLFYYEIGLVSAQGLADVVMFNSKTFPLFIGTAVFTFEGIGLVIPITESMKEPEKFPKALTGVMMGVMVLFASAGALSYAAFGSKVQTVVITNLPQNSKFVQAMQFLYSLAILLSTPLQLFPALSILERGLFTRSGKFNWKVKAKKNLFRCSVVVFSCLVAWAGANDLDKFVSLIGSTACVPLCFIYPPLLHLKANATKRWTKILNYAMLTFGIVCVCFAGSQTIQAMLDDSTPPDAPVCHPPA